MYRSELVQADTASLGENSVLLAVPSPHIFDSVMAVGSQPRRWKGLSDPWADVSHLVSVDPVDDASATSATWNDMAT